MSGDYTKAARHLALSLRQHADAEYDGKPMGSVHKAVFLARGGHAPGDSCALAPTSTAYAGWCPYCLAYDEDERGCDCNCHRPQREGGSADEQ